MYRKRLKTVRRGNPSFCWTLQSLPRSLCISLALSPAAALRRAGRGNPPASASGAECYRHVASATPHRPWPGPCSQHLTAGGSVFAPRFGSRLEALGYLIACACGLLARATPKNSPFFGHSSHHPAVTPSHAVGDSNCHPQAYLSSASGSPSEEQFNASY